ncbi:uncharacterized protein LOC135473068 isoform X2 [Liolophura sinensis]|uniref:uncharacterized protein LOC135473068 isoform X2 n=1 Tax=Liolophura sinensis TaxID=3198878 RepID=UPI0031591ECC
MLSASKSYGNLAKMTHFDERSGIVPCFTPWGKWWQTCDEICMLINVEEGTSIKDIKCTFKPRHVKIVVRGKIIVEGEFPEPVHSDDVIWTLEDRKAISICIPKSLATADHCWKSLLVDQYAADPFVYNEMQKKLTLQKFQLENPGFDFSGADMMATGDMTNNLRNLQKALKLVKYEDTVDISGLSKGIPNHFLPIYHYAFTMFSAVVAEKIADMDVELFGKSDLKFMEGVYKVLRDLFGYKPPITRDQFFSKGFAERKVIMCAEVINLIHKKHRSLCPKREASGSFRANASRDTSANLGPKVGFQRPKTQEWRVERADSIPSVSQVVRKRADRGPSRPNSARSNHPGGAGQDTSQAGKSSSPESALNNIAVPKTPGILKAKTSAVQVVYVPRAAPADTEDKQPVEVLAMSPSAGVDQGKVVEVNTQSEQLSQVLAQNSTTHKTVELLTERVMKLDEYMTAVKLDLEKFVHKEGRNSEENRETMAAFMSSVNSKIDNITARLLLAENRVAILESKHLPQVPET